MADTIGKSDQEAEQLLSSGRLDHALDVRLVQIAFSSNLSAAIRAIEMLRASGAGETDDELAGISTSVLLEAKALILRNARLLESKHADNGNG